MKFRLRSLTEALQSHKASWDAVTRNTRFLIRTRRTPGPSSPLFSPIGWPTARSCLSGKPLAGALDASGRVAMAVFDSGATGGPPASGKWVGTIHHPRAASRVLTRRCPARKRSCRNHKPGRASAPTSIHPRRPVPRLRFGLGRRAYDRPRLQLRSGASHCRAARPPGPTMIHPRHRSRRLLASG